MKFPLKIYASNEFDWQFICQSEKDIKFIDDNIDDNITEWYYQEDQKIMYLSPKILDESEPMGDNKLEKYKNIYID